MILAKFFSSEGTLLGFEISGHSGFKKSGNDIVCASVSSCAYMVANTVTDVFHIDAEIEVEPESGFLSLFVPLSKAKEPAPLFEGFLLHLKELEKDYGKYLKVENVILHK